jgi:hypothetical protein
MKDYRTHHAEKYEKPDRVGFMSLSVLEFLKGREWDEIALAYVHSLRPTAIRVTTGMMTCDGYSWRVTVIVDEENIIESIEQEVSVGLPEGVAHGCALRVALDKGIDSKECRDLLNEKEIGMAIYNPEALKRIDF